MSYSGDADRFDVVIGDGDAFGCVDLFVLILSAHAQEYGPALVRAQANALTSLTNIQSAQV